jgi:hypothetical protein
MLGYGGGSAANRNTDLHTDRVGVILCNDDGTPTQEIVDPEVQAVIGQR